MRSPLLIVIVLTPCFALAETKKAKTAVPAVPASASHPSTGKKHSPLFDSDLGGRDLAFLADAVELGSAMRYLADQAERTKNPVLRGFGTELVRTLAAQSTVLNVVAEMRKIRIPEAESYAERRFAAKVASLEGVKLDKALLDSFRELDRRSVATYEMGARSADPLILQLCEQTLPHLREHLRLVQTMTGIAPRQTLGETGAVETGAPPRKATPAESPLAPAAASPLRPGFRTQVRPPGETAPATGC